MCRERHDPTPGSNHFPESSVQDPLLATVESPRAIRDLLAKLADTVIVVELSSGSTCLLGTVGPPTSTGRLAFSPLFPDADALPNLVGCLVQVTCRTKPGLYRFHSQVLLAGDLQPWWIAMPLRVDLLDTRQSPRKALEVGGKVRLTLMHEGRAVPVKLGDASDTGLSFRFDPRLIPLSPGDQVKGWVLAPGQGAADVFLIIRHTSRPFGDRVEVLAGARFARLGRTNQDRLRSLMGLDAGLW